MISPPSGASTPDRILIRVLFPEPFSPTRLWISAAWIVKLTSINARTPPKRLLMPRNSIMAGTGSEGDGFPCPGLFGSFNMHPF